MIVLQERLAGRGVKDFWALHAKSREAVTEALGLTQRWSTVLYR